MIIKIGKFKMIENNTNCILWCLKKNPVVSREIVQHFFYKKLLATLQILLFDILYN